MAISYESTQQIKALMKKITVLKFLIEKNHPHAIVSMEATSISVFQVQNIPQCSRNQTDLDLRVLLLCTCHKML